MDKISAVNYTQSPNAVVSRTVLFGNVQTEQNNTLERNPQSDIVQTQDNDIKKERKSLIKKYLLTGLAALVVIGTTIYLVCKKGKINNNNTKTDILKPDFSAKFESPVNIIDFGKLPKNLETDISKLKKKGVVNQDGTEIIIKNQKDNTIRKYILTTGENPQIDKVLEYSSETQSIPYRITTFTDGKPSQVENIRSELDSYVSILK